VVVEPRATQKIEDSVAQEFEALVVFDRFRVLIDVERCVRARARMSLSLKGSPKRWRNAPGDSSVSSLASMGEESPPGTKGAPDPLTDRAKMGLAITLFLW
jgi:hypothetical protein